MSFTNMKLIRLQKRIKVKEVASFLGVTSGYVSNLENGRERPSTQTLVRLAGFYHVKPADLLGFAQIVQCS